MGEVGSSPPALPSPQVTTTDLLSDRIRASIELKQRVLADGALVGRVAEVAAACTSALRARGSVLWCGNGGSAADAQHLAAELTGRFYYDRPPLSSEALHANTSYLTAVANDYSYDEVYARLLRGVGKRGDVLIGLSTSGNSRNVVRAFEAARELGIRTAAFTGAGGGELAAHADIVVDVPSADTPRIQEVHMLLGHCVCELVEASMYPRS